MDNYCTLRPWKHAAFYSIQQFFSSQPEAVLWFCWGLHWTDLYLCKPHLIRAGQVLSVKTSVSKQSTVFTDMASYLTFIWILIGQMEWDAFRWVMLDLNWASFGIYCFNPVTGDASLFTPSCVATQLNRSSKSVLSSFILWTKCPG